MPKETHTITIGTVSERPSVDDLKTFAFGGVTLCGLNPNWWDDLDPVPLKSVRSLQYEHGISTDPVALGATTAATLAFCESEGIIPHMVIGNRPPAAFLYEGEDGWTYGPIDWSDYKAFMYAWMSLALSTYGDVDEWIFEVGNEFELGENNNWLTETKLHIGNKALFDAFVVLYGHLGEVITDLRAAFPSKTILYGGANLSVYSYYYLTAEEPWPLQFLDYVTDNEIPCDFASLHVYGDHGSGADIADFIGLVSAKIGSLGLSIPIWLTEWGPCSVPNSYGSLINSDEKAGTFIFMSSDFLAGLGVERATFLCAMDFPQGQVPTINDTILDINRDETFAYYGLKELANLAGTRIAHTSDGELVTTIAAQDDYNLTVVVANMSSVYSLNTAGVASMDAEAPDSVDVVIEDTSTDQWRLAGYRPNGQAGGSSLPAWTISAGNTIVTDLPLPFGEFAVLEFRRMSVAIPNGYWRQRLYPSPQMDPGPE